MSTGTGTGARPVAAAVAGSAAPSTPARRRRPRPGAVAVLLPTLLAVALTAWRYDAKPLWRDEVYTLVTAGRGFGDMLDLLALRDAGLTAYYALMNPWLAVSDASAWMRLPGAVATPVVVALVAVLGRRAGGAAVGLLAGVLAALAPGVTVHAQEARPYPLVLAALTLTAVLLLRCTDGPRPARWVVLSGVALLAGVLHPLVALPAVAALFAAALLRPGRATRLPVVLAALPAGLAGGALVLVGFRQAAEKPPAVATADEYLTFWRIVAASPVTGLVLLALAVAGVALLRRQPRERVLLAAWALAPVAAVTALGLMGSYFNARYATAAVPAVSVLAAVGLVGLARAAAPRHLAAGVAAAVLVVLVVQAPPALERRADPYDFDDAPAAAQQVAAEAQPGDAVVWVGAVARPLVSSYLPAGALGSGRLDDALLVAGPRASTTLGGQELPAADKADALERFPRVWLVGTMATATDDLDRDARNAEVVADGRRRTSQDDHGYLRVELWERPGGAVAASGAPTP